MDNKCYVGEVMFVTLRTKWNFPTKSGFAKVLRSIKRREQKQRKVNLRAFSFNKCGLRSMHQWEALNGSERGDETRVSAEGLIRLSSESCGEDT